MSDHNSGPREGIKGVVEDVKGKAKEAAGIVTGNNDLESEGRAQQDKAESQREAAEKEAQAERARAEAKVDEARQQSHQQGS
ncbi:CsbD family protein [Nocardia aobensis]|uniref:Uncharacterized protein n=3 Tax=Nocardia TaxID=1817 RepID=A0A231H3D7_9NOCA|nr:MULTISPECIES: CsbD family protein [Nocardia]MDR7170205.1 uncharacterized protein YjbJ (UPF0337 family) [Nocardia kruczakiae]NKY42218.1 CsbD family protein [Nocardia cerradoensis]OXR43375.1 hypothetical protein B7C42_04242 [Nocardia cerradoensis]PSR69982.1 CsbD family protein [Nocardia sp. MDA0666]